jgi:hypothetical protein
MTDVPLASPERQQSGDTAGFVRSALLSHFEGPMAASIAGSASLVRQKPWRYSRRDPPPQSRAVGPYEAALEMDMFYRLVTAGAAVCAFSLLGFTGQADASTRLTLKASPSLTILAQNEENSQIQNELDPQSDNGVPGGPSAATPVEPGQPGGQMNAAPQGGNESEQQEIDQEEGK